jgi:hypothetical protein
MREVLSNLLALQSLELSKESAANSDTLRKAIPPQILQHFDRLRGRGKKGVALVRRSVCSQCHMQVAVGLLADLRRGDNLYRCENCGCYLHLVDEPKPVLEMPPRITKPGRGRPRKRVAAHAA